MIPNYDVIIIGGGINGTSIAFNLAKRGVKVTLIEKDFIAGGPTGYSSGIIRLYYPNEVLAKMALRSFHIWQNFDDMVGGEAGFVQSGFLVGVPQEGLQALKKDVAMQQKIGSNTRVITADEIREIEPFIRTDTIVAAAYEPETGYADAALAATAYASAAKRLGAALQTGVEVLSIQTSGGKVTGVITTQGEIAAGAVMVAAGPWSPLLTNTVGIDLPITNARHSVCIYRRPDDFERHMVYGDFVEGVYLRPETGYLTLIGSMEEEKAEDMVNNPDSFDKSVDFDTVLSFGERAINRYPALDRSASMGGYAHLYDITPDRNHIIDELPGIDGLYCCAGGSGHGFKLAPAVGEMTAAMIIDGKDENDAINFFSFQRFLKTNDPIEDGRDTN